MPSTCTFDFDRPEPIYYTGEVISGRIELKTTSEKPCREVYIQFQGEAKTRWEESTGRTYSYLEYFQGQETYLQSRTNVYPQGNLPPGTHVFTFNMPIPLEAPSSCVAKHGHIRYEISLVINRLYRFDNVFRQPVTVLKMQNLNSSPEHLIPLHGENIKYFSCWPCSSGAVISSLQIPFDGYIPGQNIKYQLHINNQSSSHDLQGILIKLIQTYRFTANLPRQKTCSHKVTLAETSVEEKVLRLTQRVFEGEFQIPPVPPTTQDPGIINVSYHVQMDIKTGGCHTDSEIRIPVKIYSVPLAQSTTSAERATFNADKCIDIDIDERNRVESLKP